MSATYTTYLMLGIKASEEELTIDIRDDKWLPHTEGWQGEQIRILYSTYSNASPIYIGKVLASFTRCRLASWSRGDNADYFVQYIPNPEDNKLVDSFLARIGWVGESAKLMFFVIVT